ncbi:hypothetical protein ASD37_29330 [Mycobacterium sp. Root135]|uniref:sensor domain-containing protein n=1 Tax=Mycobacterium sp. Root135 TaxID=1736457 RepID=UPI0006F8BCDF|nr:sensor domain-containing protein [Mycobacterium sp. Root135]KQY02467.1 hypothetical protein ASD37_29330 [Mycobacterium sp. Root135]
MRSLGAILFAGLLLCGCTRTIDDARPQMARPVGPIAAGQVEDLLSTNADSTELPSPYVSAEPAECAALAQERQAPLIFGPKPVAHSGGYWLDEAVPTSHSNVIELVGVYHSDYDPRAAVDDVRRTIDACRDRPLKAAGEDGTINEFRLQPSKESGSPQIALWSMTDPGDTWTCENAFISAHNAAVEITTCSESAGYDVLALATGALKRIEALANMTN